MGGGDDDFLTLRQIRNVRGESNGSARIGLGDTFRYRAPDTLAEGTLYVARFNEDGTGDWLELSINNPVLAAKFSSEAELLVNTRIAADLVGATPMDRPEWTTIAADGDSVYWTLTNNSRRTEPNVANPESPNNDGHIIRTCDRGEGNGKKFDWEFFLLASQTTGTPEVFTDPDAAYADPDGRLFIGTDGGQKDGLRDQLTVFDTSEELGAGELPTPKRLFVGVNSDEITGFAPTPDQKTAMVNMQHPGNGNPAATNFPAGAHRWDDDPSRLHDRDHQEGRWRDRLINIASPGWGEWRRPSQ